MPRPQCPPRPAVWVGPPIAFCLSCQVILDPLSHQPPHLTSPVLNHSLPVPGVKTKKPIQTKFRMPLLNWVALKPNQITGTVFTELNDEKVLQVSVTLPSFQCGHRGRRGLGLDCAWSSPAPPCIEEGMEAQGWGLN